MLIFLIGHRGTGKTSLLQRLQIYGRGSFAVYDLDRLIEKSTQKTVSEIFAVQGEAGFRSLEKKILQELIDSGQKMICALGAGFALDDFVFPPQAELVWVRRESDLTPRIFLDRPRLDQNLSERDEYLHRSKIRESLYSRHFDWIYWLPEGLTAPCEIEKSIWGMRLDDCGGILTLTTDHFRSRQVFLTRTRHIGVDYFELRNDLLSVDEMTLADQKILNSKKLFAFRIWPASDLQIEIARKSELVDWALELNQEFGGNLSQVPAEISSQINMFSSHLPPLQCRGLSGLERLQAWSKSLFNYEKKDCLIKWSPQIESFAELSFGLQWQSEKPEQRNFLPRSEFGGFWSWARQLMKARQKINFFRDGLGTSDDQPTLHQWLRTLPNKNFAAVLGSPVSHSYSPIEHLAYSQHRQCSFFAIDISRDQWSEALDLLIHNGLRYAAVTAPLKFLSYESCDELTPIAKELMTVNTLCIEKKEKIISIQGHNTDLEGFKKMLESIDGQLSQDLPFAKKSIVVWGGGGTLALLKACLPQAHFYSTSKMKPREGFRDLSAPEILIWAGGPYAQDPKELFSKKNLQLVIDLNYIESSAAREYAQKMQCRYISGFLMFRAQAEAQRKEWDKRQ